VPYGAVRWGQPPGWPFHSVTSVGAIAALSPSTIAVVPGEPAGFDVRLRNNGTVVDEFTVDVVGDAAEWATAAPPNLSLFPGAEGSIRMTILAPRMAATRSGPVPMGVRISSREDPDGGTVEEGTLDIAPFSDGFAELIPRTARGRSSARYQLALDNRGNAPLTVALEATDPDDILKFDVDPLEVTVPPGAAAFAKLKAKPRKRYWRGEPQTRPFSVTAAPESGEPLVADGTMLQEPLIPKWAPRALLGLAAAFALLAIAWFALLKPTIESTAREVAEEEAQAVVNRSSGGGTSGGGSTGSGNGGGNGTIGDGSTTTIASGRLAVETDAGSDRTDSSLEGLEIDGDSRFLVTDIVLGNPNGALGTLTIRRGDDPVLVINLANFRDLDYHFVTPVQFTRGLPPRLEVVCDGDSTVSCNVSAFFSGTMISTEG